MKKKRKIPQRKCVVTNEMKPKKEMIRVVRSKEAEIFIDPSGKKNGRGAYLTIEIDVIKRAKEEKVLERVFATTVDDAIYEDLEALALEHRHE